MPQDVFCLGDMAGPHEIQELIGAGGHGEVYRAVAPGGEVVAMKVLRQSYRTSKLLQRRFFDEARILQAIDDVHVVRFLDFGITPQGVPWLAMEFLDGKLL